MPEPELDPDDPVFPDITQPVTSDAEDEAEDEDEDKGPYDVMGMHTMIEKLLSTHRQLLAALGRRTLRVTPELSHSCQKLLRAMGEPVIIAENAEAEAVCARLTTLGITNATVSEDTDTAVFGNGILLRQVGSSGEKAIIEIDPLAAHEALGLNRDSFRDMCILCGTDFSGVSSPFAFKFVSYDIMASIFTTCCC
jgi:5'-3' exonuclease